MGEQAEDLIRRFAADSLERVADEWTVGRMYPRSAVRHARSLWGAWWALPGGLPLAYLGFVTAMGDTRVEHVLIVGAAFMLAYAGPRSKQFFADLWPALAVGIGYDAVRYPRRLLVTADRVLGCGLRDAELWLFPAGPGRTWQDLAQAHARPIFDLVSAVPYAIFVYVALVYATYLYFADRPRMRHFVWAWAIGNYISFVVWLAVPAAPPWYLRAHGCTIDLGTLPSPAALSRVDALLGVSYFRDFYARSSNVFGALPSMHCAYPLIGLLTAWKAASWKTRPIHIWYTANMFVAAVYLDHHWILDAVAGWVVAIVAVVWANWVLSRFDAPAPPRDQYRRQEQDGGRQAGKLAEHGQEPEQV